MNSDGSGTVLGFTDPVTASETSLFSFNPLVYLYFMLSFLLVPYPIYRLIAARYRWETNYKSMARHWSDLINGLSYGTLLFVFGNYSKAFSWVTVVAFYPALFGYALIAELSFTKTSLPNIKSWPFGMWAVFITAVVIILAFAAFHIYYATTLANPFVAYYVCSLLIPLFLFAVGLMMIKENNQNWVRTRLFKKSIKLNTKPDIERDPASPESAEAQAQADAEAQQAAQAEQIQTLSPYRNRVGLHLHHWQIFYMLAFFTRKTKTYVYTSGITSRSGYRTSMLHGRRLCM
ncbi:hypothetical protein PHYBLDRAFT_170616 [Phycomyces blakesleeanus NRRL 1555(-)]|uniref:Uncharacterized protein n=1 Tax=Phycomyces blakesleeanus (strain ATCC 8743b / DSM 1359 / FGSC 10004 / NBRC 33097 / NRRL 1555) TaxID=763407 RepID=A0A167LWL1_PHYB8|nr:hypothetical protein PHYBLDRAFT_170616 [Phycomyces blakesleeanus NRRL 1555(-)]OAD71238.1 hypothetical protein PHYBLDRAFT_170616 [Phycomyces blakesleeanus NRRL 1555(-)]|eukprot:XP_018289278.1 hypothetical protein PHYBLDRAFT_170616 [Phycomyces blakesleeanus NRRL 1555(-)]